MPSLIDRVNNISTPSQKAAYSSGLGSLFSLVGSASNRDLAADKHGAAQAFAVMTGVQRGVAFWQKQLGGLVGYLYDGRTDKIIASTTDRKPPAGAGAMFMRALLRFPKQSKHGFFDSIAFSDWLYGETYILRLSNQAAHSDFMWANPLAIAPDIQQGVIVGYRYQSGAGYQPFDPKDVAYRIAHRNPLDDLRGQSPILSAIDEINIARNVKRALRSYYRKGMILGGVVSADDKMDVVGSSIDGLRVEMQRRNRGVDNAHNWLFSSARIKFDQFEPIDIEKNYSIVEPLRNEIMMALGVPPVLAGDPTQVNYDNADKVMLNWWKTEGMPYARGIATDFVNGQLLPAIEPDSDIYFGFDLSPFEVQEPEIITADINAGYISLATAQAKRGYKVDEDFRDIYLVNGRHIHKDVILQMANQPPEAATAIGNGDSDSVAPETGPAFNEDGIAIPKGEVFGYHLDAGIVSLNEGRAVLSLPPTEVEAISELQDLQSKLAVMVTAASAGIPPDVAAIMVGLNVPIPNAPDSDPPAPPAEGTNVEEPAAQRSAHSPIDHALEHIETWRGGWTVDKARKELSVWQRKFKAGNGHTFTPEFTRGDIADVIMTAYAEHADIEATFDMAFDSLSVDGLDTLQSAFVGFIDAVLADDIVAATKSLQSIRLDFEGAFEDVLAGIRNGEIDNRRRAGNILRQIIRTFGARAYRQGLADGGVMDDPTDEEQAEIAALRNEQSAFVSNITRVLIREDGVTDVQAAGKPEMWFRKTILAFYYAALESAARNMMMEFTGVSKPKSCATCKRLRGQRHRLKDWALKRLRPQRDTDNFICNGFNCDDTLVPVAAKARGKF